MNYCIRKLREDEQGILADFLYETIYIPEGVEAPARNIIEQPELQLYISDWGKETMKYMRNIKQVKVLIPFQRKDIYLKVLFIEF